ncbi:MAG: phytoene/squalene synthase family protein [Aggregatilineaceae bacterium]
MVLKRLSQPLVVTLPGLANEPLSRTLIADYQHCHVIMRAASKNYSFASRMLPVNKTHHVAALYAVLRVGDDRVDVQHTGFASAHAAIEDWQASYWHAFETGDSPHPVLRAYLHTAQQFDIAPDLLASYFRAMLDDLTVTRYPAFANLLHYMDGSAIPVGRAMTHILGTTTSSISAAYPAADALSIAMQLSNFWRDIGEDWARGRVYLPQEDMARFGVTEDDLAARRICSRLIALLEFEFTRTEHYYEQARQGITLLVSGRVGVLSALEIYRAILDGIRRNGYDVFTRRAGTSTWQKIGLVWRAWQQVRQLS